MWLAKLIIQESQKRKEMEKRVALFPFPLQGHLNPMFLLADILHTKGFSVSIIHTRFNTPLELTAEHSNFTFHPIEDGLTETEVSTKQKDVVGFLNTLNIKCEKPLWDCLSKMMTLSDDRHHEEAIACLIADSFWCAAQPVAESLNLPWLVLRTPSASTTLLIASLPLLKEKGYFPIKEGTQLEQEIPELPPLKVKDIPRVGKSDPNAQYDFLSRMCRVIKASQGLIFNSFKELEGSELAKLHQVFGIPIFPIGPFHKLALPSSRSLWTPDETCISWLNTQTPNSVLYVSFGSLAVISEAEFQEVAWGLANSEQPFLWVIRPGLVGGVEGDPPLQGRLLEIIAKKGHIVQWAPQQEVLAHPAIGGFWTHTGWNSTLECISKGVPMICLPLFADQAINARYVTEVWKVGIKMENGLERGEVEKAVKRLMVEKEGENIRKRITYMKEKVDLCQKEGGSSYKFLEALASHLLSF